MTRSQDVALRTVGVLCAAAALTGLAAAPPERPGRLVYVANLHSDTVSVVDTRSGTVVDSVPVGDGPTGVATRARPTLEATGVGPGPTQPGSSPGAATA
ncbi:hypothetical protein ACWGAN_29495 [Streptomyces sp. NPDC054945]